MKFEAKNGKVFDKAGNEIVCHDNPQQGTSASGLWVLCRKSNEKVITFRVYKKDCTVEAFKILVDQASEKRSNEA